MNKPLIAGLVIVLAVIGTAYYLTNVEDTYYCESKNIVTMCNKLSSGNATRCYYNETAPTKYYNCPSGWKSIKDFPEIMKNLTITGNETIEQSYFDNAKSDLIIDNTTSKYGKVEITDKFGKGDKLATLELKKNTDTCGSSCSAETEIIMYKDGILIDSIRFMELQTDKSWINNLIKSYKFYIQTNESEIEVEDYEIKCSIKETLKNGTKVEECNRIKSGTHKEKQPLWNEYKLGSEIKAGNYYIKLEGTKKLFQTIDWQIYSQGVLINDWALWQNPEIAHFTFEEGSGTVARSLVAPYYLNMTQASGTTVGWATGYKSDYSFNSSAGWFQIQPAGGEEFMKNNIRTLCVWMKAPANTGVKAIIQNEWMYELGTGYPSDGNLYFVLWDGSNHWMYGDYITTNTWQLVCWVKYAGSNYTLYQNGTYVDSMADTTPLEQGGQPVEFGINNLGINFLYDDLRVWNTSLSATDIYDLYIGEIISVVTTTLNSPIDDYISSTNAVTFNCSANTTGTSLSNISLWTNMSGSWILNETKDVSGTYNNSIFNKNIPEMTFDWTCKAFDSTGVSAWAPENRTITISMPITILDFNLTLNTGAKLIWLPKNNTQKNVEAYGQNSSKSVLIGSNNNSVSMVVIANVSSINSKIMIKCWDTYNPSLAVNLTTSMNNISSVKSVGEVIKLWCWADYFNATTKYITNFSFRGI